VSGEAGGRALMDNVRRPRFPKIEEVAAARGRHVESECVDFCPICRTADFLRATMPEEFQEHWHAWQKEMLLAMRALLDHYIHHVESQRPGAAPVEDIPIE
jgi:hypothetical protein